MTTTNQKQNDPLLICDTNIVIKMSLFKHSMFDEVYTFGTIQTHDIVIEEIERWIKNPKSQKHKKFGKEILEKALDLASGHMGALQELAESEMDKKLHQYSSVEKKYPHEGGGKETSKTDKRILALAQKNNANIATQDKPLTSLSKRVIGDNRIYGFADMVIDMFNRGSVSKEDVEGGLGNLSYFNDKLSAAETARILEAISVEK